MFKKIAALAVSLVWYQVVQAQIPDNYLIAGAMVCTGSSENSAVKDGSSLQFLVAATDDHALVGWAGRDTKPGTRGLELYQYCTKSTTTTIVFDSMIESDILSIKDRKMTESVSQNTPANSNESRPFIRAQAALFNGIRLAACFSDHTSGVALADVNRVAAEAKASGNRSTAKLPTGALTVGFNGGVTDIAIKQRENDIFAVGKPLTLKNTIAELSPYTHGLKSSLLQYTLDTPFVPGSSSSWKGRCVKELRGTDGKSEFATMDIAIVKYKAGADDANVYIDKILKSIPNGFLVVSGTPVETMWKDGHIVKRIDYEGVRVAKESKFQRNGLKYLFLPLSISIILIGLFILKRRKPVRQGAP